MNIVEGIVGIGIMATFGFLVYMAMRNIK